MLQQDALATAMREAMAADPNLTAKHAYAAVRDELGFVPAAKEIRRAVSALKSSTSTSSTTRHRRPRVQAETGGSVFPTISPGECTDHSVSRVPPATLTGAPNKAKEFLAAAHKLVSAHRSLLELQGKPHIAAQRRCL